MIKVKTLFLAAFVAFCHPLCGVSLEDEQLVTIHGIFGSPWNMYYLGGSLESEKMVIKHWGYPSRDKKIASHAEDLVDFLKKMALERPGKPIHFLTHSMGGLILRASLNHPECPLEAHVGKAVLLAPPNQGAAWGRLISEYSLANYIGRDHAGKELMTEFDFEHLGQFPVTKEVMVIAGNFTVNPMIAEANDGTVTVAETYLTTPHKHCIIKVGHKTILMSKRAALLVKDFMLDKVE